VSPPLLGVAPRVHADTSLTAMGLITTFEYVAVPIAAESTVRHLPGTGVLPKRSA